MIRRLVGALQFLTVVPIPLAGSSPSEAAVFFPLIGALLGASAGLLYLFASRLVDPVLAALLAVSLLAVITGFLHEDAVADVADAFRVGRSRERIMQVLKDSRIGSYGASALILCLLLRWQALAHCRVNVLWGLAGTLSLSRGSMVVLAAISHPAGDGLGASFVTGLRPASAALAGVQSIVFALGCGWGQAAVMIAASCLVVFVARWYFSSRLGGVNGDCLGATCQAVEVVNLLILACQPFT